MPLASGHSFSELRDRRAVSLRSRDRSADGDDVAVVPGLGHQSQRRQGFFAFARCEGVFDLAELT
jgi:hypothetical protein